MESTPTTPGDRQFIGGYGPGLFRVSGQIYRTSILVFADRTLGWPVRAMAALSAQFFDPVVAYRPRVDVLLLGAGARTHRVAEPLRAGLRNAGIVLEVMDTGAACRTFNVLMAENRRIAAALILLE